MTSLPAAIMGFGDRGVVREGHRADLVLFDANRIADRATLADPRQTAEGIAAVLVNGTVVWRGRELTGNLPGHILRRSA